jgi:predicted O-methyltransferase YrrM
VPVSQRWRDVDDYFTDLLVPEDPVLADALAASKAAGLPAIQVSPTQGRLLNLLARMSGARRILELGTLGGYSTIWLARALPAGGRLVTLEADPAHADVARANLARADLADTVEVILGPAEQTLPSLTGPFDLIFIDADKPGYPAYLRACLPLARPGTVIVADNVVRDGEVANPGSTDERVQGVRRFTELVAAEPRLSATGIQTVGTKGYDGFVLAVVTS